MSLSKPTYREAGVKALPETLSADIASRMAQRAAKSATFPFQSLGERFFELNFGKRPCLGEIHPTLRLDMLRVYELLRRGHANHNNRYVAAGLPQPGEDYTKIQAMLGDSHGQDVVDEGWASFLSQGQYAIAVDRAQELSSELSDTCALLSDVFGTRVTVTLFAAGADCKATAMHYDASDVFACQIVGRKCWKLSIPQIVLPNARIPDAKIDVDLAEAQQTEAITLNPGELLYLPRGWIHDVRMADTPLSVHLSFAVHATSWITILANAVSNAFNEVRANPTWRAFLPCYLPKNSNRTAALQALMAEFRAALDDKLNTELTGLFDQIPNVPSNMASRNAVRAKIPPEFVNTSHTVCRSGTWYLERFSTSTGQLEISVDGRLYVPVNRELWRLCLSRAPISIGEICAYNVSEEHVIDFLEQAVYQLGVLEIRPQAGGAEPER